MKRRWYIVQIVTKSSIAELKDAMGDKFRVQVHHNYEDGMVGVCPVFLNKRKADKYAKKVGKEKGCDIQLTVCEKIK